MFKLPTPNSELSQCRLSDIPEGSAGATKQPGGLPIPDSQTPNPNPVVLQNKHFIFADSNQHQNQRRTYDS